MCVYEGMARKEIGFAHIPDIEEVFDDRCINTVLRIDKTHDNISIQSLPVIDVSCLSWKAQLKVIEKKV